MRRTFAAYLIPLLILLHVQNTHAIFSAIGGLFKGVVNTISNVLSTGPVEQPISKDPKLAIQQIRQMLKRRGLQECEIDLDKALNSEAPEIFEKVVEELNAKLPRRSVQIV